MKKLLIAIIIISSLFSQSLTKGWYNDDFEVPDKLTTDDLEVLGGVPGVGKVLTDNGAGTGIAVWAASVGFSDPMTTRGDIIIRNAANATARLGIGANSFVLGSDGTDISWTDISGTYQPLHASLTSIAGLAETTGGMLYGTADNAYAWLGAGAQGTLLMGNGAGAPSWLGAGTSGYILVAAGVADPVWTVPTGTNAPVKADSPTFTTQIISPLVVGGIGTTSDLNLKTTSGVGAASADMHFLVGNNGATEAMTILNNGNVGISNTSPSALLDVDGKIFLGDATNNTAIYDLGGYLYQYLSTDSTCTFNFWNAAQSEFLLNNTGGHLDFAIETNGFFYDGSTNRVGIGTIVPSSLLHLVTATEETELVDAGSVGATEQDWISVEIGGVLGYIPVYAAK